MRLQAVDSRKSRKYRPVRMYDWMSVNHDPDSDSDFPLEEVEGFRKKPRQNITDEEEAQK